MFLLGTETLDLTLDVLKFVFFRFFHFFLGRCRSFNG